MRAILILGAAVWADGPSPTLTRRTAHGARLFTGGAADIVVPCGGMGRFPPSEAGAMAQILQAHGVPEGAILLEDQSTNTAQNIRYAADLLAPLGIRDVLIVSDAFHLPRARLLARRAGLNATASAPPLAGAKLWPQIKGWLREGPAIAAVLVGLR